MPSFLITGTSRGIGLALVAELLKDSNNIVLATSRNPSASKGLQELAAKYPTNRLMLLPLDTADPAQIIECAKAAEALLPNGLDYLVNNAGINSQPLTSFDVLDLDLFAKELLFNTVPIIRILRAFKPLILKSSTKKVICITSDLGSIEIAPKMAGAANGYSIGKAALNMLVRKWGAVEKANGIIAVLIHPGYVATDIGASVEEWIMNNAPDIKAIAVEQSATGIAKIMFEAKLEESGVPFYRVGGTRVPW